MGCDETPIPAARSVGRPPSPHPTFANGGDCPRGCATTVIEGDEKLTVYALLNKRSRPKEWWVLLESGDLIIDRPLHAGNAYSYPRALGASDVNNDGRSEWWIKVVDYASHGAPWSGANLFFVENEGLVPLKVGGEPLDINFGGIARLGEGAACREGGLALLRAEAQNRRNTRWKVSERSFEVDGSRARLLEREEDELRIRGYNDPDLDPYYRIDCDGFVYPSG